MIHLIYLARLLKEIDRIDGLIYSQEEESSGLPQVYFINLRNDGVCV